MIDNYRAFGDFVARINQEGKFRTISLVRKSGQICLCPFTNDKTNCSSWCPHFVIESCAVLDNSCRITLTCGKYYARLVEIAENESKG